MKTGISVKKITPVLKEILVAGEGWGFAQHSHEQYWVISTREEPDMVVSVVRGEDRIKAEVLRVIKREAAISARVA